MEEKPVCTLYPFFPYSARTVFRVVPISEINASAFYSITGTYDVPLTRGVREFLSRFCRRRRLSHLKPYVAATLL